MGPRTYPPYKKPTGIEPIPKDEDATIEMSREDIERALLVEDRLTLPIPFGEQFDLEDEADEDGSDEP